MNEAERASLADSGIGGLYDDLEAQLRAMVAAQQPLKAWQIKERLMEHLAARWSHLGLPLITLSVEPGTRQVDAELIYEDARQPRTRHRLILSVRPCA